MSLSGALFFSAIGFIFTTIIVLIGSKPPLIVLPVLMGLITLITTIYLLRSFERRTENALGLSNGAGQEGYPLRGPSPKDNAT